MPYGHPRAPSTIDRPPPVPDDGILWADANHEGGGFHFSPADGGFPVWRSWRWEDTGISPDATAADRELLAFRVALLFLRSDVRYRRVRLVTDMSQASLLQSRGTRRRRARLVSDMSRPSVGDPDEEHKTSMQ